MLPDFPEKKPSYTELSIAPVTGCKHADNFTNAIPTTQFIVYEIFSYAALKLQLSSTLNISSLSCSLFDKHEKHSS